jgi:hypothetical protein
MIFGANPEAKEAPAPKQRQAKRTDSTWSLVSYFVYHPKTTMNQKFPEQDRAALGASLKRMKTRGLSDDSIRKSIDRFYARFSGNTDQPVHHFLSNKFQAELTADMKTVRMDTQFGPFIDMGFERDETMALPWEPEYDMEIKLRCMRDPEHMRDIIEEYV